MPYIQGKRILNNNINLPPSSFVQKVNFKIYNFSLFGAYFNVGYCSEIEIDIDAPALYYLIDSTDPSGMTGVKTSVYSTRELDFGDEPQEVSSDFHTWITANSKPGEDKDYLIKESTLTDIANAIRAKYGVSIAIPTEIMAWAIADLELETPLPKEIATETEMTELLEVSEVGSVYKYVGESGTYENGAIYIVEEETV